MFKDVITTIVTGIIALSGAVAHDASQLSERIGDLLFPVAEISSYARVPERPVQAPIGTVRGESTSTPPTTVINQPIIERVIETVHTIGSGISSSDLEARLAVFGQDFNNRLQHRSDTTFRQDVIISDSVGDVLQGDLDALTLVNSSWTGGTITNPNNRHPLSRSTTRSRERASSKIRELNAGPR